MFILFCFITSWLSLLCSYCSVLLLAGCLDYVNVICHSVLSLGGGEVWVPESG